MSPAIRCGNFSVHWGHRIFGNHLHGVMIWYLMAICSGGAD
jgi:hypothetical protein